MRTLTDDALMKAMGEGDHAAFTELMERHRSWVRSLVGAIVQDREQAEDVTQEVFCRLHCHSDRYAGQGHFVAWLKRMAVNLAKDALRRSRRDTPMRFNDLEQLPVEGRDFDPARVLESRMLHAEVRAAIESLPDQQRLVLIMYYFGGLSVEDIAWAMKCPVGTVKTRLFHSRRRVRQELIAVWEKGV